MKVGDAVEATVQDRKVTGRVHHVTEDTVVIKLDRPEVFKSGPGTGFQQTVPEGEPIKMLCWPKDRVRRVEYGG